MIAGLPSQVAMFILFRPELNADLSCTATPVANNDRQLTQFGA